MREETLRWLTQALPAKETKATATKLASGAGSALLQAAAKCADDAAPSLREAALGFLAAFARKCGNLAVLDKHVAKLDESRRKKLEEMALAKAAAAPAAAAAAAKPAASAAARPASAAPAAAAGKAAGSPRPASSPASGRGAAVRKSAAAAPRKAAAGAAASTAAGTGDDSAVGGGPVMNADEAKSKLGLLFGEGTVKELQDEQWKVRLEAMDRVVASAPGLRDQAAHLVAACMQVPGWGDKNFQVLAKLAELVKMAAAGLQDAPPFPRATAAAAIDGMSDKLPDAKLKYPCFEALTALSEALGPHWVAAQLHKRAAAAKNPKVLQEAVCWVGGAIEAFGLSAGGWKVKELLDWAKEDLGQSNAGVRNAATHMLGVMHRSLGPPLADMLRPDIKPALMAAIEGEFEKNPQQAADSLAPSRAVRNGGGGGQRKRASAAAGSGAAADEGADGGGGGAAGPASPSAADDLLPREDISASITPALLSNLGSANWKERKAGMDEVEGLVAAAGGRIQPHVGDLFGALKGRMADTNKMLTVQVRRWLLCDVLCDVCVWDLCCVI